MIAAAAAARSVRISPIGLDMSARLIAFIPSTKILSALLTPLTVKANALQTMFQAAVKKAAVFVLAATQR